MYSAITYENKNSKARTAKQRRKGNESVAEPKAKFLLFIGGDDTDLDSAEVVARDGVCLMPVGFPARLPAGRVGHIAVRSGDMVRANAASKFFKRCHLCH